ncbi:MAG: hypothetical protein WA634_11415 [Silvibacterium sp.]
MRGIGEKIHVELDSTNGYKFFYRQNVIKSLWLALTELGSLAESNLTGPTPLPATFMLVEAAYRLFNEQCGAATTTVPSA